MNKYEVTLRTFCDACFSQRTCKNPCRRMQEMQKCIRKYDRLARAFDKACAELSIGTQYFQGDSREEINEHFLGH